MKTKYYLRGLGIGILFTAFLFIVIIIPNKENMSDEEIISEAKKLGMVEKESSEDIYPNVLATGTPIPETTGQVSKAPEQSVTPEPTATLTSTPKPTATLTPTPKPTATLTPTPKPTATLPPEPTSEAETKTVKIEVYKGMTSEQLSEQLYRAGAVDSMSGFNDYLIRNNYADFINIGQYKVQTGLSYRELAKVFTGR